MRIHTTLLTLCIAAVAVSCSSVIFEVHPCDDLPDKIDEAAAYSRSHPESRVKVLLTGGIYHLDRPVKLECLGDKFTIGTAGDAHPLFAGDVDVAGWLQSSIGEGILEAEIPAGIDLGTVTADTNRVDFYACDKRQTLARWPNGNEFAEAGKCIDFETDNDSVVKTVVHHVNGVLEYTDARIAKWAKEQDPRLLGYWGWDWYESYKKLASVDTQARSFTVDPITDAFGYVDGCRFCGLNLLCELDAPGEYYIDRKQHKIYWMAPEGFFDRKNPTTRISVTPWDAVISARDCNGLKVEGIEFRGFRGGIISFENCSGSSVEDCYIHCVGQTVVRINGGKGNSVRGCKFRQLGKMGIDATGGDRKTLAAADFEVSKCEFSHFAQFKHSSSPAIAFSGVGAKIRKCEFRHAPSSALSTGGNDIIVEHCKFSHLAEECDDQGAMDSYGDYSYRRLIVRYNRFSDICYGTKHGSSAVRFDDLISGNEVYGNVFKRCGSLKFGAVQIHGGRDNRVHHNLFIDCNYSISCSPWQYGEYLEKFEIFRPRWDGIDLAAEPYISRYPELLEPSDSINHNRNFFNNNVSIRSGEEMFRGDALVTKGNLIIK